MKYISESGLYQLDLLLGIFQLIFSIGSIYFVYRWGVALLSVGPEIRNLMIGSPFNQWAGGEDFLIFAASLYLGFKFVLVVVETARWELSMEASRKRLYEKQYHTKTKAIPTIINKPF